MKLSMSGIEGAVSGLTILNALQKACRESVDGSTETKKLAALLDISEAHLGRIFRFMRKEASLVILRRGRHGGVGCGSFTQKSVIKYVTIVLRRGTETTPDSTDLLAHFLESLPSHTYIASLPRGDEESQAS